MNRKIEGSEYQDEYGKTYIKTRWEELAKPINFGSCADKKNEDVIAFKIDVPDGKPKRNILGEMFGG